MAGFENDVLVCENVNFNPGLPKPHPGTITTNGQLIIGTTALNAGGTHLNIGNLTSPNASVNIGYSSPNITLQVAGGVTVVQTLTPDEDFDGSAATPIAPQAGNINVSGSTLAAAVVTETFNSTGAATGNLEVEHRAWTTEFVVDASTTPGARGTFSTIAAALTAASSGDTIFVRGGTYTENLTGKAGVNLFAYECDGLTPNVTIIGTFTATFTGTATIRGIRLQTNSSFAIAVTGANATILNIFDCYINCTNNTAISYTSSNAASELNIYNCICDTATTGITYFSASSAGTLTISYCAFFNTGASTTASTRSAGDVRILYSIFRLPLSHSSSSQTSLINFSNILTQSTNSTFLTTSGTGTITLNSSTVSCGSATCISVGSGTTVRLFLCSINSTNTNTISGAGTLEYSRISYTGTSSTINPTTQTPMVGSNDAVKVRIPGAYPYTAVPQDYLIVVDTSSARTINLNASPVTGQVYRIKDNTGSAAANNITVTPAAGNIDGAASYSINVNFGSIDVTYNGTQWNVL